MLGRLEVLDRGAPVRGRMGQRRGVPRRLVSLTATSLGEVLYVLVVHVPTVHQAARADNPLPYQRLPVVGEPLYRRPDEGERLAGTDRKREQGAG